MRCTSHSSARQALLHVGAPTRKFTQDMRTREALPMVSDSILIGPGSLAENNRIEFSDGLLTCSITKDYLNNSAKIPINRSLFKDDALIFKQLKSKTVSIKHRYSNRELKLHFDGFLYLGIWTQPKQPGNFICLETEPNISFFFQIIQT